MAESVFDGTWGGGPVPAELTDFALMHPDGMGWSWDDLRTTPSYVRKFCLDLLNIKNRVEAAAVERARSQRSQG